MTDSFQLELRLVDTVGGQFDLDVEVRSTSPRIALFGPSGAGKSSMLYAIAGLSRPKRGRIAIRGEVILDTDAGIHRAPRERNVGYVPQSSALFPLLSVRENLAFGRPAQPKFKLEDVASALQIERLLDRRPSRLSGGEQQRVALGRALLREPACLLFDEPFAALDHARRNALLTLVERWRAQLDAVLVFVTHQADEVEALADHVAIVQDGGVTHQGAPADLQRQLRP